MSSAQTFTISLAAVALLSVAGCEKQATTTTPTDATATDESEQPDEVEAPSDDADASDSEDVAAPLSKASFDETISEHFSEVSDCYVAALEQNPDLKGKLDADFTIDGEGRVTNVAAVEGSTLNDEGLVACISSAASSWSFAIPASGEMTLRYSFNLAPG